MQHLTTGGKSVLAGDAVAELLVRYAALIGQDHSADSVRIHAIETTGASTVVTLLVNGGLDLAVETVDSEIEDPDNAEAEDYLRSRIDAIEALRHPSAEDIAGTDVWNAEPR